MRRFDFVWVCMSNLGLICVVVAEHHFAGAVTAYTRAINLQPSAVLYANRAAAHLALEAYGSALADAEKSVELDSSYVKARDSR